MKKPCIDRRGALRAGLALAWATQTTASRAAGFDLAALSAQLARNKSGQARFTEERFVTGIDGPLRASGVLSFVAPDRFTRQKLEPLAEMMTVEGNTITLKRSGRSRQMVAGFGNGGGRRRAVGCRVVDAPDDNRSTW